MWYILSVKAIFEVSKNVLVLFRAKDSFGKERRKLSEKRF